MDEDRVPWTKELLDYMLADQNRDISHMRRALREAEDEHAVLYAMKSIIGGGSPFSYHEEHPMVVEARRRLNKGVFVAGLQANDLVVDNATITNLPVPGESDA